MKCQSYLEKAANKSCIFCHRVIGTGTEYGVVRTKSVTISKDKRIPAKDRYFHMKCYTEECILVNKLL